MSETEKTEPATAGKRGASYPNFDLEEALAKIQRLYDREGKYATAANVAVSHWGYGPKSSGGRQAISTLIQYGLIKDFGSADDRKVQITERGLDIILMEKESPERLEKIRETFESPKLFADITSRYPDSKVSDTSLQHYLIREKNVNPSVVPDVIKDYRASREFCGYGQQQRVQVGVDKKIDKDDYIQWEISGVLQFPSPRKVRAIIEDNGQNWVFVEGSEAGIPMNQATLERKGSPQEPTLIPPRLPLEVQPQPQLQVVARADDETEFWSGTVGEGVSIKISIRGAAEPTPKQLSRLIRLLEVQKNILDEDDDL